MAVQSFPSNALTRTKKGDLKMTISLHLAAIRLNTAAQILIEGLRKPKKAMAELQKAHAEFEAAWKSKR